MKASFFILPLVLALSCCDLLNPQIPIGEPRGDGGGQDTGADNGSGSGTIPDTSIYLAVVRVPDGYDWRRDSAGTAVSCTLLFYRNETLQQRLLTGRDGLIDAQPDRHHIIDGHLYTEYSSAQKSVFKKDGNTILETGGKMMLAGLMEYQGHTYTLCRPRSGSGFEYRKDATLLLKKTDGTIFGGFNKVSYDPCGALYIDGGKVCFGYKSLLEGNESVWLVKDGKEELVSSSYSARALDAKWLDGKACMAYNEGGASFMNYDGEKYDIGIGGWMTWLEGGLLMYCGEASIAGTFRIYCYASDFGGVGWGSCYLDKGTDVEQIYIDGDNVRPVSAGMEQYEDCYFFSRACGTLLGDNLYLALTPFSPDIGWTHLRRNQVTIRTFPFNGYISAISINLK